MTSIPQAAIPRSSRRRVDDGLPEVELGAHWTGSGVRFHLLAPDATRVELSLFDSIEAVLPTRRLPLERARRGLWCLEVADLGPGTLYGYRVDGPFEPQRGHRFNPSKLLVDPYARAITGEPRLHEALLGFDPHRASEVSFDCEDSAPAMPKCVVVDPRFDWQGIERPRTPWRDTLIYEAHVKGLTAQHPDVPEALRGTYLGLASAPVIEHLKSLGVTAVELLPVHQIASEPHLGRRGLRNYWGYSTLGYFAPHAGYASGVRGEQVREFQTMVRELHRHGIEVLLDVVFNHTAEGSHLGPTLSLRGVGNRSYYRLRRFRRQLDDDVTGCGNTLDPRLPATRRLVLDSLRYWVEVMGVDGFRFDLAPALGRGDHGFDKQAPLLQAIAEDPVLVDVKRIAEPWDVGPGGYQLGGFAKGWAEWNDRYRDGVRAFWRGSGSSAELATRLAGSSDLFAPSDRGPQAGITFVTAHDGFNLVDLVSYESKHNQANGEHNRDGHSHNLSRNWGVEGPSDRPDVLALRQRTRRNLVATLALSLGVPMLFHGDELGHTQQGNNNPYCQDNPTTWLDWQLDGADERFLDFVRRVLALRGELPPLRSESFLDPDAAIWWHPDGHPIGGDDWEACRAPSLWLRRSGWLIVAHGGEESRSCRLPEGVWHRRLDTSDPDDPLPRLGPRFSGEVEVPAFTLQVYARDSEPAAQRETG